ncbi:uncharacterized protein LOC123553897 [Mercenaria mercenaria]|uniref:uncharacterized protein LOC123553897 n=1 Tax=Mercenaria mercenaria TaxID=6596 RepID=UPI00234F1829|nr:uncharacterized protein LOC123553897 [Mercenaria mercenaria]XP_053404653.1 uncharacterized protein LOC123553897 [Mercenaria mercenaria]XP_053404654.1 uncharacterized protein LOC123553897 [Mercenaria mercenaria]
MPKVVFPCDFEHWWRVKDKLHQLKEDCLQREDFDVQAIAEAHQIVVDVNQGVFITEHVNWGETVYYGLVKYFRKHATVEERRQFVKITFPSIIDLGLDIEALHPTDGIDINEQQKGETREIDRNLCCSIVACGFLCLFPAENRGWGTKLNQINFNKFFANLPIPSQNAKLRCILHFFERVTAERNRLHGALLFTRQVIKKEELPTLDTWLNCNSDLCHVDVRPDGLIEDAGCNTVEVDFANRYIGGGVLSRGRVQEEIRFTVCPELIVSLLFMEVMEENEAIIIQGYEQFSAVQGYASDLRFAGDHRDKAEIDEHGNLKNMLCAIDAVSYRHESKTTCQYQDQNVLRDLNKAFTGFNTPFILPPGVCARSLSEESYVTAKESEDSETESDGEQELLHRQQIDIFVEELLQGAITLALTDATKVISSREERHELPPSGGEHYFHRQSSMDHLEVNFRDWYANYRRRSSNLSDLSSRRSSYDLASRRSSACSARGYSSEYSSEFEEYYDNFQQQEQKYKYHTIKEEVGTSVVSEFASSLAASLLRQGAEEASGFVPCEFHGSRPSYNIQRPLPVRVSTASLSTLDSVENEDAIVREDCIRQYVDNMFETIWPFSDNHLECEGEILPCVEIKQRILENRNEGLNFIETSEQKEEQIDDGDNFEIEEKKVSTDVIDENDEGLLLAVADRIVAIAFQEALFEYQYLMCSFDKGNTLHISSVSESSQSDHSIDTKDQPELSSSESSQSKNKKSFNSDLDPAFKVAEKMLSGLFSKKESELPTNLSPQTMVLENQSNIPKQDICDTNLLVVDSTSPRSHSSSSDDSELSASKRREMFSRIADKVSVGGLTTKIDSEDKQSSIDVAASSLNQSSDSSQSDSSVGRQLLPTHPAHCDYKELSSQLKSHSPTNWGGEFRNKSSSSESKSSDSKSSDIAIKPVGNEIKTSSLLSPKKYPISTSNSERRSVHSSFSQKSVDSNDRNKLLDSRSSVRREFPNVEAASQDLSLLAPGSRSGSKNQTGTKVNKLHHLTPQHARLVMKPGHYFVTGNKKNYDQFANSLSRDLLTNAFLQVQEHNEPVAYPRRSSEPMQISNGAALQRYEHSFHTVNGKRSQKSKTDEDIPLFKDDWIQQYNSKSSSGFRDPVLSRFAEELMKANVSVPPLQLPVAGDNTSISGSSHSVCSTISSFRDPLLASFEEELINSADKKSAKTQTSWSRARGSMCSPRLSGNSNSSSSRESKKQLGVSMSMDSETSYMSNKSSNALPKTVSEYAETLSRRIFCEALTIIYRASSSSGDSDQEEVPIYMELYSDMLATSILKSAVQTQMMGPDWFDQSKVVTWSEETECVHYNEADNLESPDQDSGRDRTESCSESVRSSGEFEDALDIPYQRLEEFADVLASKVLINSVAISRREYMCSLRGQYGRPIATGNWGCGAFGGDPHLKSLLQWMAASYAGCPCLLYYTFRNPHMDKLQEVVSTVIERGWDVSKLMQVVRRYCIIAQNELDEQGFISRELFDIILQGEIFPGV